jgi:hypothetical protein
MQYHSNYLGYTGLSYILGYTGFLRHSRTVFFLGNAVLAR